MKPIQSLLRCALILPALLSFGGCINLFSSSSDSVPPHMRQLPGSTQALLAINGMTAEAPIFVRIFKEEKELEVWKLKNGRFELFRTYPICAFSGDVGPKVVVGDRQAPEGFYTVNPGQMNPKSAYHLAFNIGYPNAHDRANNYSGSALMVHGNCKSVGCYAMTDTYIEEIYIMARDAFAAGQTKFHVHAFPFRMTTDNMRRHQDSPWYKFWVHLKEGYDAFETYRKPPVVKVCSKRYLVNVNFPGLAGDPAADEECPKYAKIEPGQGVDGVPQALYASLSKPAAGSDKTPAPAIALAVSPPAPAASKPVVTASADAGTPEISASPVVRAKTDEPLKVAAVSKPARESAVRRDATPQSQPIPVPAAPAPAQSIMASALSSVRTNAAAPAQTPMAGLVTADNPVSKEVDQDALQKPNRSAKGGKLATPPAAVAQ